MRPPTGVGPIRTPCAIAGNCIDDGASAQAAAAAIRSDTRIRSSLSTDNVVPVAKQVRPIGFLAWRLMLEGGGTGGWTIVPCEPDDVRSLAGSLGVSGTTASVLARRGYCDADEARRFLEGALPGHDPFALGDMAEAVDAVRTAIAGGRRICVHGDYDADGICATALAVTLLRELDADVS